MVISLGLHLYPVYHLMLFTATFLLKIFAVWGIGISKYISNQQLFGSALLHVLLQLRDVLFLLLKLFMKFLKPVGPFSMDLRLGVKDFDGNGRRLG